MSAGLLAALAAGILSLAGAPAAAALPGAIGEAVAGCATGLEDSAKETGEEDPIANEIQAALDKPPAGAPPVSENALAAAKLEAQQAKELLGAAAAMQQQARAKLESVAAASNPAEAQVRLREAQDMVAHARNMTRRAKTILHPQTEAAAPGGAGPAAIRLGSEGSAMAQLIRAGRLGQAGAGKEAFYEARDPAGWDEGGAVVVVPGGRRVGVRPLLESFRRTAGPGVPLFQPVAPPAPGAASAYRLSPQAEAALRDPKKRAELENVGGVELRVTLDLLEFSELADFRKSGPALIVERPVLLSLTALASAAQRYQANWEALPDGLRYPGGMERIVGFIIEPARGDIFLVGVPALQPSRRIDLDSLVVGLRAVWREGQIPGVSLDPLPDAPGGAQYPRVVGVPETSSFARIMLDADYAMKRIMLGAQPVAVPGYTSLLQLLASSSEPPTGARFWFFPAPLITGDLQVSATARTVLFNSGLKVLTESGRLAAQGFVGTGASAEVASRGAQSFTEALDALESSGEGAAPGVFVALHGLVDIVTLCSVWRKAGIDMPLLRSLAALPVSRLEGARALPRYYPGVTTSSESSGRRVMLTGGVQARVRASQRSLDRFRDRTTLALESAAASFPRDGTLAQTLALRMTLPRAGSGGRDSERALSGAETALAAGDYARARAGLRDLTRRDPLNADAWAYLAQAHSRLGEHAEARAAMARARALEPVDEDLRVLALDVELHADRRSALASTDQRARRALAEDYALRAAAALAAGDDGAAKQLAETAGALDDANADAYYIRALSFDDSERAIPDLQRAVERYRRRFQKSEADADAAGLARSIGLLADLRAAKAVKAPDGLQTLQGLLAEVQEARRLEPLDPGLLATEVNVRLGLELRYRVLGRKPDTDLLLEQADRLVRRHPDFPRAHYVRSLAYRVAGRSSDAIGALTSALKHDPTFAQAYAERAGLYLDLGLCTRARADAAEARKWKVRDLGDLEKQLAKCTT